jgi:hypothetical protein
MPNRIIHEKACNSLTLDALSDGAERLFWRLTTKADDYGRFDADPRSLLGSCFPLKIGRLAPSRIGKWRDELSEKGVIGLYRIGERVFGAFTNWRTYQRTREGKPKYPSPDHGETFAASRGEFPRDAARVCAIENVNVNGNENVSRATRIPPPMAAGPSAPSIVFQIPESVTRALSRAPRLGADARIRSAEFWQAQLRARPGVDFAAEVFKAEAWIVSNPDKAPKKKLSRFLHTWLGRAAERTEV